eukprot:scaffold44_cov411-Prasinococcus_capsulatus_cf.AAC.31
MPRATHSLTMGKVGKEWPLHATPKHAMRMLWDLIWAVARLWLGLLRKSGLAQTWSAHRHCGYPPGNRTYQIRLPRTWPRVIELEQPGCRFLSGPVCSHCARFPGARLPQEGVVEACRLTCPSSTHCGQARSTRLCIYSGTKWSSAPREPAATTNSYRHRSARSRAQGHEGAAGLRSVANT